MDQTEGTEWESGTSVRRMTGDRERNWCLLVLVQWGGGSGSLVVTAGGAGRKHVGWVLDGCGELECSVWEQRGRGG